ncbi:hexose transporter [Coniophora puteana RWD-64-598 SS2]|uniref:Hexose transporter n=1 Tax=Coniophora puteana (strain RWD-64-598) TaxID=741705 RepID=A0A5M3MXK6_CONPW|nr:hexose transporter [Coniophora puteana RWD-64-598 SS2]EIW83455.1 hexose transporter [Coniophora puteana RWD-64-598 SS2]
MTGGAAVVSSEQTTFAHLIDPRRKWYNNKRLIVLHAWIVLLLITSSTNGYDGSMMNGLQSLAQWRDAFDNPSGGKLGLLNAIQNIGALAGYPFAPYVSDGIGRRKTVWFGATIMLVGTALQTASQSVNMFIGARFLIGFGLTFSANAAPMLVTEIAYPVYRAPLTSMYNGLWYSGSTIAAWTTYGTLLIGSTWAWRLPSLLQGLPSVLQFILVLFAPESPRWLVNKGREAEALGMLAYYHADGNEQDPLVQYEFEEIKAAITLDREVSKNVGWKTLIATPGNRRRMRIILAIAFFLQWSGNGLVSYYLNKVFDQIGITSSSTQLLINGILQVWNLIWSVSAALYVDRIGRRPLFLASTLGMLLFYTAQVICFARYAQTAAPAAGHAVIAFIFLFYSAFNLAYSSLIVSYTVEILPFQLRAKGFNVFQFTVSLALVFNQYVNPIALQALGWKYYIVYVCWLAVELVFIYFYLVETKNRTLEETAALFDGEDKIEKIAHKAALGGSEGVEPSEVREDVSPVEKKA